MPASRLKLRTVFLIVHMVILLLPVCSLFFFRLYENMLVRQTEQELISQGIMLASSYKQALSHALEAQQRYGTWLPDYNPQRIDEKYTPIFPLLDLAHADTLPARPDGTYHIKADEIAAAIGEQLTPMIVDARLSTLSGMLILDYQGVVVAGTHRLGQSLQHVPEVASALLGDYRSVIRERTINTVSPALSSISRGTGIRIFAAVPIIKDQHLWGVAYLSRTPQNILKHLYDEKEKVILAGMTIVGATIALSILLSYAVSGPIARLMRQVERIRRGDQTVMEALTTPGTAEIAHLSQSFIDLSHHLHERSQYIKEFAMHVSHEFKTPLTSIQGAIELLEDDCGDMSDAQQKRFLRNIGTDAARLHHLVLRLLELARADNLIPENATCTIAPIIAQLREPYTHAGLAVTYDGDDVSVSIAPDILETVLRNLFDNALGAGATAVTLRGQQHNSTYILTITDNGEGISSANRDKLFTPFFTTRRDQGGTGLGLRIVRSMVEAYGGSIQLDAHTQATSFHLQLTLA